MSIVDAHAFWGKGRTWDEPSRSVEYRLEELLERGAAAGIDRYCVTSARTDDYPVANREIARLCARNAELIGFAAHSPAAEAGRLETLVAQDVDEGLRGIKTDGPPNRELCDAARRHGLPILYSPRQQAFGLGPARWYHMPAQAYPDVAFILPHLGDYRSLTWYAHIEAIDLAKRYPNVYLDTSGIGAFKYLEQAARELPAEKLLFGTYAPELDPRVERHAVELLGLTASDEAKILGGNLLRLLP